jgi:hypothetical protein
MMRQRNMQTTTNPQLGLLDSLMTVAPTHDFLERLDRTLNWRPIEKALQAMYPAAMGRPVNPDSSIGVKPSKTNLFTVARLCILTAKCRQRLFNPRHHAFFAEDLE